MRMPFLALRLQSVIFFVLSEICILLRSSMCIASCQDTFTFSISANLMHIALSPYSSHGLNY